MYCGEVDTNGSYSNHFCRHKYRKLILSCEPENRLIFLQKFELFIISPWLSYTFELFPDNFTISNFYVPAFYNFNHYQMEEEYEDDIIDESIAFNAKLDAF